MPTRRPVALHAAARTAAAATGLLLLAGCAGPTSQGPAPEQDVPTPSASALAAPLTGVELPPHPLRSLVPAPHEAPAGLVPLLAGSGPRDAAAIAAFSADPGAAAAALAAHGFADAYVAQYAHPTDGQVLSVVVVRFADAAGATADLEADLAGSSGELVSTDAVGAASETRRQPLGEDTGGELLTLRFRQGATTWLLAYGARPTADPAVAVELGRLLAARATD